MRGRILLSSGLVLAVVGVSCRSSTFDDSLAQAAPAPSTGGLVASLAPAADPIDHQMLAAALEAAGVELPEGTSVYAASVEHDDDGVTYAEYDAGGGALAGDFWPASSIKVLAAEGALEYLATLGFTGAATITIADQAFTVSDVYDAAIVDSSNEAYDLLVQIAGVDWLNTQFLTAANGLPDTVIERSYSGEDVRTSPAMTISEGSRMVSVPARESTGTYACPDDGNCSNLLELTNSIREVALAGEIPATAARDIAADDVARLDQALLDADGFVEPAVTAVFGDGELVYKKPGYVPGDACVDVALVTDTARSHEYLLGIATPDDGPECPSLVGLAQATLTFLVAQSG